MGFQPYSKELIESVWQVTRPANPSQASKYLTLLNRVLTKPKSSRYLASFLVKKSNGGTRKIVPATADLAYIQLVLSKWVLKSKRQTDDYCYSGLGVKKAVSEHRRSHCGLVVDLQSAFDKITRPKLLAALRRRYLELPLDVLDVICDLVTFQVFPGHETTPQGCVSTPNFFNAVMFDSIKLLAKALEPYEKAGIHITRYADNIAVTFERVVQLEPVYKAVRNALSANGFALSWYRIFDRLPIEYIGTKIAMGTYDLADNRAAIFMELMIEAIQSPYPEQYSKQISGMYSWTYQICGYEIPDDLFWLFDKYYRLVGKCPRSFVRVRVHKKTYPLF